MRIASGMMSSVGMVIFACGFALIPIAGADEPEASRPLTLTVDAGRFDRLNTPVHLVVPADRVPDEMARAADGSHALIAREIRDGTAVGDPLLIQADRVDPGTDAPIRLTWILIGPTPAEEKRFYRIEGLAAPGASSSPWAFGKSSDGQLELSNRGAPVFRYNTRPVVHPDHRDSNQPRDAYIHPAHAPSGAIITGDYSRESHPHHRGFFLAYTKTEVGDLHPDFWNIQGGRGKIWFDRLEEVTTGPVSARFSAIHRWEASRPDAEPLVVLRERWDVEALDIPGRPYWLIDLTSTQQATETPMVLPPYRYGGMAYRGPDSFFPRGVLDVLTSEGLDRVRGDQKPARWVDLTGPIADGSDIYAGAAMFDHPSNINHPTPARIHPTRLPFFCFVPSHDTTVTIGTDKPTVFRYRILIHDGHPDADRNERAWRDFAEPPTVTIDGSET